MSETNWSLEETLAKALCYRSVGDVHAVDTNGRQRWNWYAEDAKKFIDAYGYQLQHFGASYDGKTWTIPSVAPATKEKIDDGGRAFPGKNFTENGFPNGENMGMTLRDYFAGQVLSGFMSAKPMHFDPDDDAAYCYRVADAMIAARRASA